MNGPQIDFPFGFDSRGGTATSGGNDHVLDLIEQLLFTNPGERVMRPDFGSGLLQLVFAPNSPELAAALQFTMQAALQRWLGDVVQIEDLVVASEDAILRIGLRCRDPRTGEERVETLERRSAP
jgi:phage baseplate assembly protein W